jgi:Domain of unknown function (DUF4192)
MTADTSFISSPPALRLRGPVDLVVAVPYLLGFRPDESLVLVALDAASEVAMVARVDLPRPPGPEAVGERAAERLGERLDELGAHVGDRVLSAAVRAGAVACVAVLYPGEPAGANGAESLATADCWRSFAKTLQAVFGVGGVELVDCLAVGGGRWRSLFCDESDCCPRDGGELPASGTTEAEAAAVLAGLTVQGTRADLGARFRRGSPGERAAVAELLPGPPLLAAEGMSLVDEALSERLARLVDRSESLPAAEAAALLRAVADVQVRDAVSFCPTAAHCDAAECLWTELVRVAPPGWLAGPASLLAAAAYQAGNGVLAGLAVEAALDEDPDHGLADQLARALAAGMPPREVLPVFKIGSAAARAAVLANS